MGRIRAVIGLCVVCAVAIGVVGAQGASAAIKGTTGFTCKATGGGGAGFSDAHCKTAQASGAKFEHVAIPTNTKTEGRVTNERTASETTASTPTRLLTAIAGVVVELQAAKTEGLASGMNTTNGSGEHVIEGLGSTTYSEVTVTKPAGKGCKVPGGKLVTEELRGISTGMEGKLEPAVGTTFMTVTIEGCSVGAINGKYPITGSVQCPNTGVTIICTHAATTTLGTLKFGGQKAGVEVATTATARAKSSEEFVPVSATTIEE